MQFLKRNFLSLITLVLLVACIAAGTAHYSRLADDQTPSESNGDQIIQNLTNNNIEITSNGGDASAAAAKGLQSTVSIYCSFTATVGGTSPWNPYPSQQTYYTTGSGVIYDVDSLGNAFIITNYHVVYDADSDTADHISEDIYVYLYGREDNQCAISAYYVGGSANYDIAVLRVDKSEVLADAVASGACAAVSVANSDTAVPGDTAIAIGNPSSSTELSGISVTKGIISVDSEYITMTSADESGEVTYRVIRVDTPINSGNSGGGLYNAEGELIGIVNAKISSSSVENIGYAIPSNIVRAVADNIIDYCYEGSYSGVVRCILGITVSAGAPDTYYDGQTGTVCKAESVTVEEISSGSLAEDIFRSGDIIRSITIGEKTVAVTRQHHLIDTMLDARVGDEVIFTVERNGQKTTLSVTVDKSCLTEY